MLHVVARPRRTGSRAVVVAVTVVMACGNKPTPPPQASDSASDPVDVAPASAGPRVHLPSVGFSFAVADLAPAEDPAWRPRNPDPSDPPAPTKDANGLPVIRNLRPRTAGDGWTFDATESGATIYLRRDRALGMVVLFQLPAGLDGDCAMLLAAASPRWATKDRSTKNVGDAVLTRMVDTVPARTVGHPPQPIGSGETYWSLAIQSRGRCVSVTVGYDERLDATLRPVALQTLDSIAPDP